MEIANINNPLEDFYSKSMRSVSLLVFNFRMGANNLAGECWCGGPTEEDISAVELKEHFLAWRP